MIRFLFILLGAWAILQWQGCGQPAGDRIIGVKIYQQEGGYEELFREWQKLGINSAFTSEQLLSEREFRELARENHVSTFVIFPVFFNPEALADDPGLYAIDQQGRIAKQEWVEFVCPSREAYRKKVVERARRMVTELDPEGISIDFIRHFVFWEKVYPGRNPATLPVTCFDSLCLDHFQAESGIILPETVASNPEKASWILENHLQEWTRWRCGLVTAMVKEIADAAREVKPEILVNIHLVPWSGEDFNGALKRVAGQDLQALAGQTDFLSPMTYAHMVKREPPWIHSLVEEIYMQTGGEVLPSIQVNRAYLETGLDLAEFEASLEEALKPPSRGVVFWSWEQLDEQPRKKGVVAKVLKN